MHSKDKDFGPRGACPDLPCCLDAVEQRQRQSFIAVCAMGSSRECAETATQVLHIAELGFKSCWSRTHKRWSDATRAYFARNGLPYSAKSVRAMLAQRLRDATTRVVSEKSHHHKLGRLLWPDRPTYRLARRGAFRLLFSIAMLLLLSLESKSRASRSPI